MTIDFAQRGLIQSTASPAFYCAINTASSSSIDSQYNMSSITEDNEHTYRVYINVDMSSASSYGVQLTVGSEQNHFLDSVNSDHVRVRTGGNYGDGRFWITGVTT